jgi:hypothetical protein
VAIAGTNQDTPSNEEIARARFLNVERAALIEALREHFGKALRHVLND